MACALDTQLPEINTSDFEKAWIRFELVASAQEWDENRQLKITPTLLSEGLLDCYMELSKEEKLLLQVLKKVLLEKNDLAKDPLIAGKEFTA